MVTKTIKTTIVRDGPMCFIPISFDPKAVFGKVRAPVKVTLNNYTFRSTIAAMGGPLCIPLRRSNREAAGLDGGETLEVRLDLDTDVRKVKPPADLVKALKGTPPAMQRWGELSYSHQREYAGAVSSKQRNRKPARGASKRRFRQFAPGRQKNASWNPRLGVDDCDGNEPPTPKGWEDVSPL